MQYFHYFISFLWLVFGLGLLIIPEFMRKVYMEKFSKFRNIKPWCLLPLLAGVLFFLSAKNLKVETFGYTMSMLAIFKGLYLLVIKKDKIKQILDWWIIAPAEFLRIWGVLLACLAVVLLSLMK